MKIMVSFNPKETFGEFFGFVFLLSIALCQGEGKRRLIKECVKKSRLYLQCLF